MQTRSYSPNDEDALIIMQALMLRKARRKTLTPAHITRLGVTPLPARARALDRPRAPQLAKDGEGALYWSNFLLWATMS